MGSSSKLTIVSTCTNQKRGTVSEELHLGSFAGRFYREAAKQWIKALEAPQSTVPAHDLYLGSHWQESLATQTSGNEQDLTSQLWVLSAGYGLVPATEKLAPYAASFAGGPDSIQNLNWPDDYSTRQKAQEWWSLLHHYRDQKNLRRFTSLARSRRPLLIILSREYYAAIEPEIIDLVSAGVNLLLVSAGLYRNLTSVSPVVRPYVLPFSDAFKQVDPYLNKTNVSLNARLANWLVKNHLKDLLGGVDVIGPMLKDVLDNLPPMERKEVIPMSDDEVLAFIAKNHSETLNSATRLLRQLRDVEQKSCEQKRFGSLYRKFNQSHEQDLFGHE